MMPPKDPSTKMPQTNPTNLTETSESESKASEKPHPGDKPEVIVEPPAAKTKEEAKKEERKRKRHKR